MSEILRNPNFRTDSLRIVRLMTTVLDGRQLDEVFAKFDEDEVRLVNMRDDQSPERFIMTADEMDALFVNWEAYKADRAAAIEAEVARRVQVLAQALSLIERIPVIRVERANNYFNVFLDDLDRRWTYLDDEDQLLDAVQSARRKWHEQMIARAYWQNEGTLANHVGDVTHAEAQLVTYAWLLNEPLVADGDDLGELADHPF